MALTIRDSNDENILYGISFPTQLLNPTTPAELELHLWNNKGESCAKLASNVRISVVNANKTTSGGTNYTGQEIIDNNLIQAKSDGIVGSEIVDDAQSTFTAIGKTSYLSVGDIPVNCARKIFLKLQSEAGTTTEECVFYLKIRYNYGRIQAYQFATIVINHHAFLGEIFLGGIFL